jgi:DinB superfamily
MIDLTEVAIQSQPSCDRGALLSELEATRSAFHALVEPLSEDQWQQKSPTSAWTVGEVLVHLTWALEQLPKEVASACRSRGMFNFPKRLADPLSYWRTRWTARNATRASIVRQYDSAMAAVIRALDEVKETDWALGAQFYGEGFYMVADLFHTPAQHFVEHTTGL